MKMIKKAVTFGLGLALGNVATFAQSLDDAKKAIDAEQYTKASGILKQLIISKAKDGNNYFYLGKIYMVNDYIDSARTTFTEGITKDPKNALNYVGLGMIDFQTGDAGSAKTNFDKAVSMGPKKYETYLAIGKAYLMGKKPDFAAALPNLEKADELDSKDKDPDVFVALGDYYAMQRDNSKAYGKYLLATDINPNLSRVQVQIGKMYKEAFAFADAESFVKRVLEKDPDYGPAYRELAEIGMQWSRAVSKTEGDIKKKASLDNMRKYLDLTDKSFDSRLRYAQFLVYAGDWLTLSQELQTLKASEGSRADFVLQRLRGYSAIENKDYETGKKELEKLFASVKDSARLVSSDYLYFGLAQKYTNDDSLAFINIAKAVKKDSTLADTLAGLGQKYYTAQKYLKAIEVYKTMIEANSKNPNLVSYLFSYAAFNYYAYGEDLKANRPPKRELLVTADSTFVKVSRLAPDYESTYLFRGRVNNQIDYFDNKSALKGLAIPYYQKYVELITAKPDKAAASSKALIESYNNLGSLTALTDVVKAKEYFSKTLALDPTNAIAQQNMKILTAPPGGVKTNKK